MNPKTFRDHISQQCGFNDQQVEPNKAKPYALQVCNAGKMPDHLPQSFSEWLASNNDSIEINDQGGNWTPDRVEATAQWFDNKAKTERSPFA